MPSTTSSSRSLIALSALALTCTTTALPILGAPPFASTPPHTMPGAKAHPPSVKGPDSDHPMFLPDSPNTEDSGFNTGIIIAVLMLGIAGLCAGAAIGMYIRDDLHSLLSMDCWNGVRRCWDSVRGFGGKVRGWCCGAEEEGCCARWGYGEDWCCAECCSGICNWFEQKGCCCPGLGVQGGNADGGGQAPK